MAAGCRAAQALSWDKCWHSTGSLAVLAEDQESGSENMLAFAIDNQSIWYDINQNGRFFCQIDNSFTVSIKRLRKLFTMDGRPMCHIVITRPKAVQLCMPHTAVDLRRDGHRRVRRPRTAPADI
jgi:hypothetical protein